jgi:competence protein ComEC
LAAEILVAPHHGHRNLSTPAFLNAVQPRYVLFATGYHNRFGYPRPETVARYQADGRDLAQYGLRRCAHVSFGTEAAADAGTLPARSASLLDRAVITSKVFA